MERLKASGTGFQFNIKLLQIPILQIVSSSDHCPSLCLVKQVEFNKAAQSLSEALMPSSSKIAALTRLLKDNVALIVVLEARDTKIGGDMQGAPGKHGQLLCVVSGISLFLPKDIGGKCLWNIWPPKQQ
jgi:hypothetical protein